MNNQVDLEVRTGGDNELAKAVHFRPRRLGHANLFVNDLDRSMAFYQGICGLEEVRREPGISAGFLSNGNSHHDIGLVEIGEDARVGIGGYTQVAVSRMKSAGLNHLGWELENEKQLVEAYERAVAAGVKIHRTTDHQIAHSVYVFDPEGNLNEFYADSVENWRTIFNPSREDLVSSHWDPLAAAPNAAAMYDSDPQLRTVPDAAFQSLRITHVVLGAKNLDRLRAFYEDVGGLDVAVEDEDGRFVCLKGTSAKYDLVLYQADDTLPSGFCRLCLEAGTVDPDDGVARLSALGVEPERCIEVASKRSIFVKDPSGIEVEIYEPLDRAAAPALSSSGGLQQPIHLV